MRTVVRKLKEKRGSEELIGGIMALIVSIICVVLLFSAATIAPRAVALYAAADEIAEKVATDGKNDVEEEEYIDEYLQNAGLGASYSFDRYGVIQMGQTFTVTLKSHATVGIGNIGHVDIPLAARVTKRSKVYTAGY